MTNTTNTTNTTNISWSAVAMGSSVYIVRTDGGEIVSVAYAGDTTDRDALAAELLLARAVDGDTISEGADDLLVCLPTDEAEALRADCAAILDASEPLADCAVLVDGGEADAHELAGLLGNDGICGRDGWFGVVRALLSDEAVVRALLDLYPSWALDVHVDRVGGRADLWLCGDFFAAPAAADAARYIERLDAVYEMLDYDMRASSLRVEGVREAIEIVELDDEEECIDGRRIVLAEEVWTWSDEHAYVQTVYDRVLAYAGVEIEAGAAGALAADADELPEWAQDVDWDYSTLDRVDAQRGIRDAKHDARDGRAVAALEWADGMLDVVDGRYPRSL